MTTDAWTESRTAADIVAVTQLVLLERESRDSGRWDRMRTCFHVDSFVRLSWYSGDGQGFVSGSIVMVQGGMLATHRLGPVLVRVAGDRAVATLSAVIDIPGVVGGTDVQLSSHARFMYRAERRRGEWKISGFDAVYVRDEMYAAIPGETFQVPASALTRFRKSYRLLSFLLQQTGYVVDTELPGDDRPDSVRQLEEEIFSWAAVRP